MAADKGRNPHLQPTIHTVPPEIDILSAPFLRRNLPFEEYPIPLLKGIFDAKERTGKMGKCLGLNQNTCCSPVEKLPIFSENEIAFSRYHRGVSGNHVQSLAGHLHNHRFQSSFGNIHVVLYQPKVI